MRAFLIAACVLLGAHAVTAQPLTYDLYYVLPGEQGSVGVDFGFASPAIADAGDLSDLEAMAKYSLTDYFEIGARATLGVLNDGRDDLAAFTVGAKYGLGRMTALMVNLSMANSADALGISAGVMNSMLVGDYGVNSHAVFAFQDGYIAKGALIDVLVQPVLPLGERAFAYLDLQLASDTDMFADRLSFIVGPNLDYELLPGLVLNGGVEFSLYSGKWITHDTDLGVVVSLFKTATPW